MKRTALLIALAALAVACTAPGATTAPSAAPSAAASVAPSAAANIPAVVCVGAATTYLDWLNGDFQPDTAGDITEPGDTSGDLLEQVQTSGKLRVSTDSNYAPQSFLEPDGSWVGFDIDVATEIADRLGVTAEFMHVDWDVITAGNWANRWDISVGSMTITTPRKEIMSFTQPYYYTPAFMAASERSGVTSLDQLPFEIPGEVTATTFETDANCIEAIAANRPEFDLLITSETVIDEAVAGDQPIVKIGEPIYVEELAVSLDRSEGALAPEGLLYEIDRIIGEMHEDGTLTELSNEWFDADLTQAPSA